MLIGKLYRRGEEKERKGKGKEKETKRTGGGMERKGKEEGGKRKGRGAERKGKERKGKERKGKERKGRRRVLMICFNSSCKKRVTRREGPGSFEEPFRVDLLVLCAFQNTPTFAKDLQS